MKITRFDDLSNDEPPAAAPAAEAEDAQTTISY